MNWRTLTVAKPKEIMMKDKSCCDDKKCECQCCCCDSASIAVFLRKLADLLDQPGK